MTYFGIKWPVPVLLAMATAAMAILGVIADPRIADLILDSSTGVFAVLCALIAVDRVEQRSVPALHRLPWLIVLLLAVVDAVGEFAEPLAHIKGHNFSPENADDLVLLVAGPIGLWLTSRIEPRPIAAQLVLAAALLGQLAGAALDLMSDGMITSLGISPDQAERYADVAQALSLLCFFMAIWLLVGDRAWTRTGRTRARSEVGLSVAGKTQLHYPVADTLFPPPFLIGLRLADSRSPAGRIHRLCNEELWPAGDVVRSARNLGTIALWPFVALLRAMRATRNHGMRVRRLTGKSRVVQCLEQISIAVLYRITPRYYYTLELYRRDQRKLAGQYLTRSETKGIAYRLLYPFPTERYEPTPLKNKMEFARHCQAHGIAHAPVLMLFEGGRRIAAPDLAESLPAADVFLKPALGKGGIGSEAWRSVGSGTYRDPRGRLLNQDLLIARAADLSRKWPYLIQLAMKNHRDLLDLSVGALCTVRVLSCRNEAGGFEVTDAALRMPVSPTSSVDNFHAGGIAAAVDVRTGRLGPATDLGLKPDSRWHERHPLTGAAIAGRYLPLWRETMALATHAHRTFGDYALVGWDVAILDDGPCLIEGNRGPDLDLHQRTSLSSIGDQRFGELLAHSLERRKSLP